MSQPRQFEGPDVRQLLDDIRDAYGGDEPTIARAETFRSGGVLGFFQREQYRLTVDPTVPPPRIRTHGGPTRALTAAPAAASRPVLVARTPAGTPRAVVTPSRPRPIDEGPVGESDFFALLADTTLDRNFVSTTPAAGPTPEREPVAAGPSANPDPAPINAAPQPDTHPTAALPGPEPRPQAAPAGPAPEAGSPVPPTGAAESGGSTVASFDSILERLATILENSKDDLAPRPVTVNGPSNADGPPWAEAEGEDDSAEAAGTEAAGTEAAPPAHLEEPASPAGLDEPAHLDQPADLEGPALADNGWVAPADVPVPENGAVTSIDPSAAPIDDGAGDLSARSDAPDEDTDRAAANVPGGGTGTDEALWWGLAKPTEEATVTEPGGSSYPSKENGPVSGINPFSGPTPFRAPTQASFGRPTLTREPSPRVEEVQPNRAAVATDTPLGEALLRTGLSAEVATLVVDNVDAGLELPTALTDALIGLPRAPALPRQPRALIVIAGPGRAAIALANETATEVGTDAGDVLVASTDAGCPVPADRRIRSAQDASALAPGYRRSGVAVVAVDVPAGSGSQAWAAEVIAALRPTLVLGIIDAVHKTEDMAAWIGAIGGVDAVVIENPDATVSPASVLALPVPVARLGHQPASPGIWVSAILDRVGACG